MSGICTGLLRSRVDWVAIVCWRAVSWSCYRKAPAVCRFCARFACCAYWSWCDSCRRLSTSSSSCSERWTASPRFALFSSSSFLSSGQLVVTSLGDSQWLNCHCKGAQFLYLWLLRSYTSHLITTLGSPQPPAAKPKADVQFLQLWFSTLTTVTGNSKLRNASELSV